MLVTSYRRWMLGVLYRSRVRRGRDGRATPRRLVV